MNQSCHVQQPCQPHSTREECREQDLVWWFTTNSTLALAYTKTSWFVLQPLRTWPYPLLSRTEVLHLPICRTTKHCPLKLLPVNGATCPQRLCQLPRASRHVGPMVPMITGVATPDKCADSSWRPIPQQPPPSRPPRPARPKLEVGSNHI